MRERYKVVFYDMSKTEAIAFNGLLNRELGIKNGSIERYCQ